LNAPSNGSSTSFSSGFMRSGDAFLPRTAANQSRQPKPDEHRPVFRTSLLRLGCAHR
jgi:hypothetical protein